MEREGMALGAPELETMRMLIDTQLGKLPARTIGEGIERLRQEEVPRSRHPQKALSHIYAIERYAGDRLLASLADVAVQYRLDHPGLAVATCNRRLAVLRRVARLAYWRWGWLSRPVYIELQPENNQRQRYLSLQEVERLIDACDYEPTRDAVILAVYTGMRRGELFVLTQAHVRGDCLYLPISKNGESRTIPILAPMRDAVARLPLPCAPRHMSSRFKRACRLAGLADFRFHDLRHTTASLLINGGHSLKMVQEVLGHRSVQSANRYAHLAVKTKRAALEGVFGLLSGNNLDARPSMR